MNPSLIRKKAGLSFVWSNIEGVNFDRYIEQNSFEEISEDLFLALLAR